MEKDFWLNKWVKNEIGFHRQEFTNYLTQFWGEVAKDKAAVFIPLCGKSRDMIYLSELGHDVIGVELSKEATLAFFKENYLEYKISKIDEFDVFKSSKITIYVGSLFDFRPEWAASCRYLYDRASLVALPKLMRKQYAKIINQMNFESALMITMDFEDETIGPPFTVKISEIYELFGNNTSSGSSQFGIDILFTKKEQAHELEVHGGKVSKRSEFALKLRF